MSTCPYCGLKSEIPCQDLRNELGFYDLSLQDEWFIHQLVVDTYTAQHAQKAKPIGISFALIGLYFVYEKGLTGRQVQKMHMALANRTKVWPYFDSPTNQWEITVADVMEIPEGEARNEMIKKWGRSVWEVWKLNHYQDIENLIKLL